MSMEFKICGNHELFKIIFVYHSLCHAVDFESNRKGKHWLQTRSNFIRRFFSLKK